MERQVSVLVLSVRNLGHSQLTWQDYVWIHPDTGEIRCWLNNLPEPWSPAGNNDGIIGSGVGPARTIYLAVSVPHRLTQPNVLADNLQDMNGDGVSDLGNVI